jgi:hypothetical protein
MNLYGCDLFETLFDLEVDGDEHAFRALNPKP